MGAAGPGLEDGASLLPRQGDSASSPSGRPEDAPIPDFVTACCSILGALLFVACFGFLFALLFTLKDPPQYSVAVAAVSGLDFPAAELDPVFNVTVRVTSKDRDEECLDPATSVQVSYLRVALAGGRVRPGHCAPPRLSADRAVVARGKAVVVPGFMMDSLVEDVRTGEAVFEVTLMKPVGKVWVLHTCWAMVGDAASLDVPCIKSYVDADVPVPTPTHT